MQSLIMEASRGILFTMLLCTHVEGLTFVRAFDIVYDSCLLHFHCSALPVGQGHPGGLDSYSPCYACGL